MINMKKKSFFDYITVSDNAKFKQGKATTYAF